eukprot:XP_001693800.1 predicted protein [Chlamydomonas reinhardtii]
MPDLGEEDDEPLRAGRKRKRRATHHGSGRLLARTAVMFGAAAVLELVWLVVLSPTRARARA